MRRLLVIGYVILLGFGLYVAYQRNSSRLPERVKLTAWRLNEVEKVVVTHNKILLEFKPDKDDEERWIFSSNLDTIRSYGVEAALVTSMVESLRSAQYMYLVEDSAKQSLQRYGLGKDESYEIQIWLKDARDPVIYILGALAVNGYDVFVLHDGKNVYRASFLGLYERMEALGRVIDVILGREDRIFG